MVAALDPGVVHDLGEFRLPRPPILVAGRVIDRRGVPRGGVRLIAHGEHADETLPLSRRTDRHAGVSSADGRYEIRGEPLEGLAYTVSAGQGYRSAERSFRSGMTNIDLEVTTAGSLRGRVRSAIPELRDELEIVLWREKQRLFEPVFVGPDGRFEVRDLRSGSYKVEVFLAEILVKEVTGIEIVEDRVTTPAELDDLIVGRDFHFGEVTVTNAAGDPIVGCHIALGDLTDEKFSTFSLSRDCVTDFDGFARVIYRTGERLQFGVSAYLSADPRASRLQEQRILTPKFPLEVTLRAARERGTRPPR